MKRRRTLIGAALLLIPLALGLAACSSKSNSSSGYEMIEDSAAETQDALTARPYNVPSPTPGPSAPQGTLATPLPVGTPYVMPTNPPGYDGSLVITRVGDDNITLADYQKRVRFDRYRILYGLVKVVEKHGTAQILDLTRPENSYVASLLTTLADSYSFGKQSHRLMVIDLLITQEALRRGIEVDPQRFDAKAAEYLGLVVGTGGSLPPEYNQRYAEFLKGLQTYAGMSEEEFRKIVRAQALYDQIDAIISSEPGAVPQNQREVGIQVEDAVVPSQDHAQQIANRLRAGESLPDILTSLGYKADNTTQFNAKHSVRRSDASLTDAIKNAAFTAQPGDVIGPFAVPGGWYIGQIGQQMLDILTPQEISQMREQYFQNWLTSKMDDPTIVKDNQNWLDFTPQDPLPRDVSPLLRDENFILPPTPTPEPTPTP